MRVNHPEVLQQEEHADQKDGGTENDSEYARMSVVASLKSVMLVIYPLMNIFCKLVTKLARIEIAHSCLLST